MYGSERAVDDAERTAFRKTEKKYKLYYEDKSKSSKKYLIFQLISQNLVDFNLKKKQGFFFLLLFIWFEFLRKKQPKQVDLSEVLDFKSISESYNQKGEFPPGVVPVNCGFDRPIFRLENRPGIYFSLCFQ